MKKLKLVKKIIDKLELGPEHVGGIFNVADESVKEIVCVNVLEFVPGRLRGLFMDEAYRVLVPEGKMSIAVPYWSTARAIQDYAQEWPPFAEQSFLYFNKGWREQNNIKRDLKCDFDFTYGYQLDPEVAARNEETRSFNIKHYINSVVSLQLVLTKR